MGMFDSVIAKCPRCGSAVEFQSKAGDCCLADYPTAAVPLVVAADLNNSAKACVCGATVTIEAFGAVPNTIAMNVKAE